MPEGGPQNNPPKQEGLNIKPFSTDFVKAQIEKLLGSVDVIKTVKSVEVSINAHNQMRLDLAITAKGFDIGVTAVLVNKGDSLAALEEPKVEANFLARGFAKEAIKPHVDNVGKLLKDYIEKTENQRVEKIEIKNGQLEVTFEKKTEDPNIEAAKQTNTAVEKTVVSIHPKFKDFTLNLYKELINHKVFNLSFVLGLDFIKTLGLRKKEVETILTNLIETKIIKENGAYYEIEIPEKDFENHLSKYELITNEEIKNVQPPKKPAEKPEPRAETLPPGVFSAEYIKDIVFDLLEEEGKTPESYEIIKDKEGIQTFVLKFTDGTTNEHSVRGVLGLRLKIPIFDLEGIEPVDGGKNFRLVWKTDIESEAKERPKSEKEIELAKLLEREQEIDAFREALLKKLEEIERKKKK